MLANGVAKVDRARRGGRAEEEKMVGELEVMVERERAEGGRVEDTAAVEGARERATRRRDMRAGAQSG